MTTTEIFDTWDTLADESIKGYWRNFEKAIFLNQVRSAWMDAAVPGFERNETLRRRLVRLIRQILFDSGSEWIFPYKIIRIIKVEGLWDGSRNPLTSDGYREIVPDKRDRKSSFDPYHSSTPLFPRYREYGDSTQERIVVTTAISPDKGRIEVITTCPKFDEAKLDQQWDDYFPEAAQREMIKEALLLAAIPSGDVTRLQSANIIQ